MYYMKWECVYTNLLFSDPRYSSKINSQWLKPGSYYSMGEHTGGCLYREPNSGRIIRACDSEVLWYIQMLCIRGTLILNYCDSEVLWSLKIVSCQQNRKLKNICSLGQSWWRLPLWGEYQFMATSPWLQNMKNLTSAKVCEDTSGPEECIEPPDAVTFGFKNRSQTFTSSQLN